MSYPEVISTGSKGGIHSNREGPLADYMRAAQARGFKFGSVKAVDNLGLLLEAKGIEPQTITIARLGHAELEAAPGMDGLPSDEVLRNMAATLVMQVMNRSSQHERDNVDLWELWNEPRPHTVAGYVKLARLMEFSMEIAAQHNLRIAIFSLNAGTPEWDEYLAILGTGVMQKAMQHHAWIALHESLVGVPANAPVDVGFGTSSITNPYTGATSPVFADAGPYLFRYRFLLHAARELRIELPPITISEWGCIPQGHLHSFPDEEVMRRFGWYDAEASRDGHNVGFHPFTVGQDWDSERWERYYPAILNHLDSVKTRVNAPRQTLPSPLPPPKPEFAKVRVNAARKWNLRIGPGTQFEIGGAASSDTIFPVLESVWGRTGTRVEAWYLVMPQGYPPTLTAPLWIASSAVTALNF